MGGGVGWAEAPALLQGQGAAAAVHEGGTQGAEVRGGDLGGSAVACVADGWVHVLVGVCAGARSALRI